MKNGIISMVLFIAIFVNSCKKMIKTKQKTPQKMTYKIQKTKEEWKKELSSAQFHILIEKGTESPGTGEYNLNFDKGSYVCAACSNQLFDSSHKYESHCGWPSFDEAIQGTVIQKPDFSLGMKRIEIVCANCGGHLGHIFDDGPQETTGKRYCVNSMSLKFEKE